MSRKVNTGVPQGSKLSPSLFSFYIAGMPRPTDPVKRVYYADDLTVWTSGVNIPDLEVSLNNYIEEITAERAERVSSRNNIIKALAGTSWGQQKETLLMTYKAFGRSIINYAAPVWSPNLHDTNLHKNQYTQNEALRIATGCNKMSSIDHLHTEAAMLKVREHSEKLSAQYLARCMELGNVCHPITTRVTPEKQMKETLYTRHRNTVEPMMVEKDRKVTLQALHTGASDKAVNSHERNVVLDGRPPPISNSEKT